jgi:hypothetical protein
MCSRDWKKLVRTTRQWDWAKITSSNSYVEAGRRFILIAALFVTALSFTHAAEVSADDSAAIRAVITEQLDAFARDDAARAFALATPGIRARFDTPEAFLEMVRTAYPVVYRPRSVEFDASVIIEGEIMQPVRMIDAQGAAWIALYPMERQANGTWRINGCQLARITGRST